MKNNNISLFDYKKELDWMLLSYEKHAKLKDFVKELNHFYKTNPQFWQVDDSWEGFRWISADDYTQNVFSYIRFDEKGDPVVCLVNFSPVTREDYRIGVPRARSYTEVFSSDEQRFGGAGISNGNVACEKIQSHGSDYSISLTVPGNSALFLKPKYLYRPRKTK